MRNQRRRCRICGERRGGNHVNRNGSGLREQGKLDEWIIEASVAFERKLT